MPHDRPTSKTPARYATLEPRTEYVSQAAIRKRWRRLPASSGHNALREICLSARHVSLKRDGRGRLRNDVTVHAVLEAVTNRLINKIPKIPCPPSTNESHFDHEANVNRIARIEAELTSNTHSMALLRTQIKKDQQLAEEDQEEVKYLERSLKSNQLLRRQQIRTLHPAARIYSGNTASHAQYRGHCDGEHDLVNEDGSLPDNPSDDELISVLNQLRDHLGSIQANISTTQELGKHADRIYYQASKLMANGRG